MFWRLRVCYPTPNTETSARRTRIFHWIWMMYKYVSSRRQRRRRQLPITCSIFKEHAFAFKSVRLNVKRYRSMYRLVTIHRAHGGRLHTLASKCLTCEHIKHAIEPTYRVHVTMHGTFGLSRQVEKDRDKERRIEKSRLARRSMDAKPEAEEIKQMKRWIRRLVLARQLIRWRVASSTSLHCNRLIQI